MTANEKLLPCPFCNIELVLRGDYTHEAAWNFWCHPDEDADCVLAGYKIQTGRDMKTPHPNEKAMWNTRASPSQPAEHQRQEMIRGVAEMIREDVRADIYEDLTGVDRCAECIVDQMISFILSQHVTIKQNQIQGLRDA
jgi:hypothetical protein